MRGSLERNTLVWISVKPKELTYEKKSNNNCKLHKSWLFNRNSILRVKPTFSSHLPTITFPNLFFNSSLKFFVFYLSNWIHLHLLLCNFFVISLCDFISSFLTFLWIDWLLQFWFFTYSTFPVLKLNWSFHCIHFNRKFRNFNIKI